MELQQEKGLKESEEEPRKPLELITMQTEGPKRQTHALWSSFIIRSLPDGTDKIIWDLRELLARQIQLDLRGLDHY